MSQKHCVVDSNSTRDTMKKKSESQQDKNKFMTKANDYRIWLIGDRCDGWEKVTVQNSLNALLEGQDNVPGTE